MEDKLKRIKDFIRTIEESPDVIISKEYKEETVFNFGKYKGKTFKWVIENDRSYIMDYCMTYKFERDNPDFTFSVAEETKKTFML